MKSCRLSWVISELPLYLRNLEMSRIIMIGWIGRMDLGIVDD